MTTDAQTLTIAERRPSRVGNFALVGREVLNGVWPLLTLALAWWVLFILMPPNTFLKSPIQVAQYLTEPGEFTRLLSALSSSLWLVVLGYVVATLLSLALASAMVTIRPSVVRKWVKSPFMPWPYTSWKSGVTRALPMA